MISNDCDAKADFKAPASVRSAIKDDVRELRSAKCSSLSPGTLSDGSPMEREPRFRITTSAPLSANSFTRYSPEKRVPPITRTRFPASEDADAMGVCRVRTFETRARVVRKGETNVDEVVVVMSQGERRNCGDAKAQVTILTQ